MFEGLLFNAMTAVRLDECLPRLRDLPSGNAPCRRRKTPLQMKRKKARAAQRNARKAMRRASA